MYNFFGVNHLKHKKLPFRINTFAQPALLRRQAQQVRDNWTSHEIDYVTGRITYQRGFPV